MENIHEHRQRLFAHPFSFKGRIRRLEFGISWIISFMLQTFLVNLVVISEKYAMLIVDIPILWFIIAQSCKRFHDRNRSGWMVLLYFIPIVTLVVWGFQMFADGDPHENQYGSNPKG